MKYRFFALPLALIAGQAMAAPPAPREVEIPPELTDPAMADRLANMMQVLSRAFLDLPAGEIQAAAEGRAPTAEEKRLTVRDMGRRDDPNFDRNFNRQMAQARPMIEHGMKALAQALPAMTRAMSQMAHEMERAAANMPQPVEPQP